VNYRSAFRLDPDVDRAYHLASVAAQKHSRGAEPNARVQAGSSTQQHQDAHEFRFERTLQFGPDYDSRQEHRTKEEAQRESGRADADSTHPSSTAFLLRSLLKSFAENPWVRPPPTVRTAGGSAHPDAPQPTSPNKAPVSALPRGDKALTQEGTVTPSATPEEALAALHFIPADEEQPLPLARLPYEVLLLVLRHLVLSSMLPPPRLPTTSDDPAATPLPAHGCRANEHCAKRCSNSSSSSNSKTSIESGSRTSKRSNGSPGSAERRGSSRSIRVFGGKLESFRHFHLYRLHTMILTQTTPFSRPQSSLPANVCAAPADQPGGERLAIGQVARERLAAFLHRAVSFLCLTAAYDTAVTDRRSDMLAVPGSD
jgi:hypothetical protein